MTELLQQPLVRLLLFILLAWVLVAPPLLLGAVVRRRPELVPITGPCYASYACLVLLIVFLAMGFYAQVIVIAVAAPPLCGVAWMIGLRRRRRRDK